MLATQGKNDWFGLRSTQPHISGWEAECQFSKKLFFQLHMAIQISIRVCLFAAWTACLRYGSDLFADFLGKMALGHGWAVGRAESLWLQCV